jgi:glycosyltransferase involved in cell wall biosynthesis
MSRLLLLSRKLDQGGAERQLVTLARALRQRGHDVHVVLFYAGGAFDAELVAANVPAHFAGKRGRWDVLGFMCRLVSILRQLRPATIYSFLDVPNVLAALLGMLTSRPRLVWSVRAAGMEMQHYDWLARLVPKLEVALSRFADIIVANSQAGKNWATVRGFPVGKIVVIENGIDTDRFRFDPAGRERVRAEWQIRADEVLIGLVGRLDPMKGHDTFLSAAVQLVRGGQPLKFVCVGGGSEAYARNLELKTDALGLGGRVMWGGPRSGMAAVFSALDLVVSSSSFGEGFPNVIAEAMACERPCVVTNVGDSARIVGATGEVVPPRNAEALARGIEKMLDRTHKEPDLGKRARDRIVSEFSVERMVARTETILHGARP